MTKINRFYKLILVFLFTDTLAQDHILLNGSVNKSEYSFSIPFEYEKNMIIIRPEISGKKRKFVFDTGAPTSINSALASELNLPIESKSPSIDGFNNIDTVNIVVMPAITLGDVNFTKIGAIISNPIFHECTNLDGMIGSNLFQNSVVQILFKDKKLVISSNIKYQNVKNNLITDLFLGYYKNPYLLIKINSNITDNVLFDTGAGEFYTMSDKVFNNFRDDFDTTKIEIGNGSCGFGAFGIEKNGVKQRARLDNILFCGSKFKNISVIPANTDDSRIGVFMIEYGDVTIDYVYSKLYFHPYKKEFNLYKTSWNINPTFYNGKIIVGFVWGKTANDVSYGDEIILMDNKTITFTSFCDYYLNNRFYNNKRKHKLLIKTNKGELKPINMTKK
jgi:hypothetical protein